MTERNQVDGAVSAHLGPLGRFVRIDSAFAAGVPDWHYVLRGTSGWIESKLVPRSGRRPDHFTREQLLWGEAEVAAGGRWFLLALREPRIWLLYDALGARAWFDGTGNRPIVESPGRFPTREIVRAIAPVDPFAKERA